MKNYILGAIYEQLLHPKPYRVHKVVCYRQIPAGYGANVAAGREHTNLRAMIVNMKRCNDST